MLRSVLAKRGHHVTVADDGMAAIEMLKGQSFDIILMDIEMPVMDGMEATRRIRKGEAGEGVRNIPILAVTAHVVSEVEKVCREAGVDGFVGKPVKIGEIGSTIEDILSKKTSS